MGIKYNSVKTVTIELKATELKFVEELTERLKEEYLKGDWDWDSKGEWYEITCKEAGTVICYPGVMYTSNGDGYPDEYDEDFEIYADDVEEEIEKYVAEHYEDVVTDWNVSEEVDTIELGGDSYEWD